MYSPRPDSVHSETSSTRSHHRHHSHSHHKHKGRHSHVHHHHGTHTPTESPLQRALDVLRELPALATLDSQEIHRLAMHLYACAYGIRTSHWIKEYPLGLEGSKQLAEALNSDDFPMARKSLAFIYEPVSGRSMAINKHLTLQRVHAQLDEGYDSDAQWFIKFDRQGVGRFIQHEEVPFFSKALKRLVPLIEALPEDDVSLIEMPKDWVSENGDERITLMRLLTVQHFLLAYSAIYVIDEAADSVGECCGLLGSQPAWIGKVMLEGERPEDDHVLIKCTFPEHLFSPDDMDLSDETAALSLKEVADRLETKFLERLDSSDLRKVWRSVNVTLEGPKNHSTAWKECGSKRWAVTERTWSLSSSSDGSSSPATTPGSEDTRESGSTFSSTVTTPSDEPKELF